MAVLDNLLEQIEDKTLRDRIRDEIKRATNRKSFGLVFEEHLPECTPLYDVKIRTGQTVARRDGDISDVYVVGKIKGDMALCLHRKEKVTEEIPVSDLIAIAEFGDAIYPYLKKLDSVEHGGGDLWHTLIEADNYHALQLLEYMYAGKVDCIYIDPPYNTGAKDWKYNNNYVDSNDEYRHSKWLSFMKKRLELARKLLNPKDSVLIVTIDEKEYLHLGCLLEEIFPFARMQMISSLVNRHGTSRSNEFSRTNEYIFFVMIGDYSLGSIDSAAYLSEGSSLHWHTLRRSTASNIRDEQHPNQFYPIYVNVDTHRVEKVGDNVPFGVDRNSVPTIPNCETVFPIREDGTEMMWGVVRDKFVDYLSKGYARVTKHTPAKPQKFVVQYLQKGVIQDIENGNIKLVGYEDDGSVIGVYNTGKESIPSTQWAYDKHDARDYGTKILNAIIAADKFDFPKSVYAVNDCLRLIVANKPDSFILDFFAGSGTTLHAVNLLNAEDGGHRRCIMVTNNEVSEAEAKSLTEQGYHPGDPEWDALGIARYVTWPRTVCSIEGHDVNGKPLTGNYGVQTDSYVEDDTEVFNSDGKPVKAKRYKKIKTETMPKLAEINKADGFASNCIFFKLGFLDKNAVSLGRQFKELLPILWMKAGAVGACPELIGDIPDHLILKENRFAVLINESAYAEFITKLDRDIDMVYIVTNSDAEYRRMASGLKDYETYQLYRDYLDNFKINRR